MKYAEHYTPSFFFLIISVTFSKNFGSPSAAALFLASSCIFLTSKICPIHSSADLHHSIQVGTLSLKISVPHLWQSAFSSSLHISIVAPQLLHLRSIGVGVVFRMLPGHLTLPILESP